MFYGKTASGLLLPRAYSNFVAASEVETEDIQGFPLADVGELQVYGTSKLSTTWTITTTQQYMVEADIAELFYGVDRKATTVAYTVPKYAAYTIDETGEIELADADDDDMLAITLIENDKHTPMIAITAGTPEGYEYLATATGVEFDVALAGKTVMVISTDTIPIGTDAIGGANGNEEIVGFEIHGAYKIGDQIRKVWFPQCQAAGGSNVPIGSTDDLEKEYRATVPTALGWSQPYLDYPVVLPTPEPDPEPTP